MKRHEHLDIFYWMTQDSRRKNPLQSSSQEMSAYFLSSGSQPSYAFKIIGWAFQKC